MGRDENELFEEHFRRFADPIYSYALRRVGPDVAQDVTAQTFLSAWRRRSDAPAEPLPWLYGIARGVLANELRADRRRGALSSRVASQPATDQTRTDEEHPVMAAMALLSSADQELLLLVAWEGLSAREAAVTVGCSPTAAAVRLHRARRRLARILPEPTPADVSPNPNQLVSEAPK